jgi:phosphoribosylformylglycinamidine synthase
MAEACSFFETPITGGNVSLYNETLGEAVFPSPVVGVVGLMKTARPVRMHFDGDRCTIYLLGGFGECDPARFGGTSYAKHVLKNLWGLPPALDMEREKRIQECVRAIVERDAATSIHDLSDGGLAVALAEGCFGPEPAGAWIDIHSDMRPEYLLFHEGPSRVLVATGWPSTVEEIIAEFGVEAVKIGVTYRDRLEIRLNGALLIERDILELKKLWEEALEKKLHG